MKRPGAGAFLCATGPACNNHCTICPVQQTLPTPAGASLLAQLRDGRATGLHTAVLAGGEPLLRREVFRLLSAARRLGLETSLVTNGRLLVYEAVRRRLAHSGCGHVRVQLFGGDEAAHDAITMAPGSFAQAMGGVEAFQREHGDDVQVEIGLALTRDTAGDVAGAVERIAARLPFFEIGILVSVFSPPDAPNDWSASLRSAVDTLAGWNARRPLRPLLAWEGVPQTLAPFPQHLRVDPPMWTGCCGQPDAPSLGRAAPPAAPGADRECDVPLLTGDAVTHRWLTLALRRMKGRIVDVSGADHPHRELIRELARDGRVEHHDVTTIKDHAPAAGYFDYVLALRAPNRFTDVPRALSNMAQALRSGGSMLLTGCTPFAPAREHGEASERGHNFTSFDVWPELRLLPLRVIFHRPVSAETGNEWILQAMKI